MSAPHTPGPWFVGPLIDDDYGFKLCTIGPFDLSESRNDTHVEETICEVSGINHDALANAHRIVACVSACEGLADPSVVPELLAALKDAVALADRNLPNFNGLRTEECRASYKRCKAAITKAEGR